MSSDDAVGARRIGPFFQAIDLSRKRVVLIDAKKTQCWSGNWVGLQYQPVLLLFQGRWFVGRYSYALSDYETPPGCRQGITFVEIDVTAALIFCDENGLNDPYPPELIEAYESSKTSADTTCAEQAAGTTDLPTDMGTTRPRPQASPGSEATKARTPPVETSKNPQDRASREEEEAAEPPLSPLFATLLANLAQRKPVTPPQPGVSSPTQLDLLTQFCSKAMPRVGTPDFPATAATPGPITCAPAPPASLVDQHGPKVGGINQDGPPETASTDTAQPGGEDQAPVAESGSGTGASPAAAAPGAPETGATGSKTNNQATKERGLDDLTPTGWKLLRALSQLEAFDSERAAGRAEITKKARTGNHDSKHNQEAFSALSHLGLIKAKRNAGTWLTQAGIDALDKRSKNG
jgi:hypothetical protein